jgi:hypothetical protein
MQTEITIRGRKYAVEQLPADKLDEGRVVYKLTGARGAIYYTIRNRPNPTMMFLMREGTGFGAMKDVWLTDKDGTLREAR